MLLGNRHARTVVNCRYACNRWPDDGTNDHRYQWSMTDDADFRAPRVYLEADLAAGETVACTREQTNYLRNVLRLGPGGKVLVFNGRDGEWQAELRLDGRRDASLTPLRQVRPQQTGPDLHYLFAPLKHARLDYMVQKATEMGAARLAPVLTQRTVPSRVNLDRMRANVIEAAEQCGILTIPDIIEPRQLEAVLSGWDARRALIFCDEGAAIKDPVAALASVKAQALAVLIGPEGGFTEAERDMLLSKPFVIPISLGPRIMRADTAAVAALALVNTALGDWR
jgi:16S rRNA (uracil1498-N3)-methyltransferase